MSQKRAKSTSRPFHARPQQQTISPGPHHQTHSGQLLTKGGRQHIGRHVQPNRACLCRQRRAQSTGPKRPIPLDQRPPFNLDTRIEGEEEVDELTGKYIRRQRQKTEEWNRQTAAEAHRTRMPADRESFGPASGAGGDPSQQWANSLRASLHRMEN